MQTRDATAAETTAAEVAVGRADSFPAGIHSPQAVLALQRKAGNRAVARLAAGRRLLQRDYAGGDAKRWMAEGAEAPRFKADVEFTGPAGDQFVWDEFDRTLTIFTPESGPHKGQAFRLTYVDGSADDLSKLSGDQLFARKPEVLSPLRAKALKWLRGAAGLFQETETKKDTRVGDARTAWAKAHEEWAKKAPENRAALTKYQQDMADFNTAVAEKRKPLPPMPQRPKGMPIDAKPTLCNLHVGEYGTKVLGKNLGGMDPRQQLIDLGRAGAFCTLESHPFKVGEFDKGPQAGDIISYGQAGKPKPAGLRKADFATIMHVGVVKSRRPGKENGTEIWTVVDGGQGGFEKRQEVRERVRVFTIEHMEAQMAKQSKLGDFIGYEMEAGKYKARELDVGVFKQKPTDYVMRGWADVDTYATGKSEATPAGAGSNLFPQKSG